MEQNIENGNWPELSLIPTENDIASQFDASRMTARRAIMELVDKKKLVRQPGVGTFVAQTRPTSSLLKIKNIADEVHERGHTYSNQLLELSETRADLDVAEGLEIPPGTAMYYSKILHFENGSPIQLENRFINKQIAADYIEQTFNDCFTPASFLQQCYPLTRVLFNVEARSSQPQETQLLHMEELEPVLLIRRKTWCQEGVVSYAELLHPGSKYQLGGELNFSDLL